MRKNAGFGLIVVLMLSGCTNASSFVISEDRWEGVGYGGIEVGRMIEHYEDKRNTMTVFRTTEALLDFVHVVYANHLALEVAKRENTGLSVSYYCQSQAKSDHRKELELFIAWVKLQADEDESILKDPMVVIYPLYLLSQYPLSTCPSSE